MEELLVNTSTQDQRDANRDWVVTKDGKIVRRDKAKATDVIPISITALATDVWQGPANSFATKEDAYKARDYAIEKKPNAFLPQEEPKKKPGPKPKGKIIEQDEFRDLMRQNLMENFDEFWTEWKKLRPDDKCATYTKLLLFAYSKAPNEKVVDPADAIKRKAEAKRQAAADKIAQGLEEIKDTDFEE